MTTAITSVTSFGIDQTWRLSLATRQPLVRVRHNFWSGRATIEVDGRIVFYRNRKLVDFGLTQAIELDGSVLEVRVTPSFLAFRYELSVVTST